MTLMTNSLYMEIMEINETCIIHNSKVFMHLNENIHEEKYEYSPYLTKVRRKQLVLLMQSAFTILGGNEFTNHFDTHNLSANR